MSGGQFRGERAGKHLNDEVFSSYIDNTLSPRERIAVEKHIAVCPDCAGDLGTLQQTVSLLRDLPRVSVPRAFTLRESDIGLRQTRQRPIFGFLRSATVVVAMLLAVVVAGDLLMSQGIPTIPAVFEGAVLSEQMVQVESESQATAAPVAKMMAVEPTPAPAEAEVRTESEQPVQAAEKEAVAAAEAARASADVAVTVEVEKEVVVEKAAEVKSVQPTLELTTTPESSPTATVSEKAMSVQVTEMAETSEAESAPTLSAAERMLEVPAEPPAPGIGGGGEGAPGTESGGVGGGIGGGVGESPTTATEQDPVEEESITPPPAVLRPTETPTSVLPTPVPRTATPSPTLQPTVASTLMPTVQPPQVSATVARAAPPATVIAEVVGPPAEPATREGFYGTLNTRAGGLPLIRLIEIALLLIVLALISAAAASRQRR